MITGSNQDTLPEGHDETTQHGIKKAVSSTGVAPSNDAIPSDLSVSDD